MLSKKQGIAHQTVKIVGVDLQRADVLSFCFLGTVRAAAGQEARVAQTDVRVVWHQAQRPEVKLLDVGSQRIARIDGDGGQRFAAEALVHQDAIPALGAADERLPVLGRVQQRLLVGARCLFQQAQRVPLVLRGGGDVEQVMAFGVGDDGDVLERHVERLEMDRRKGLQAFHCLHRVRRQAQASQRCQAPDHQRSKRGF